MNRNNTIAMATFLLCSLPCSAVSVSIWKASDAPCGQSLGYLTAEVSGGTGPYTYLWSNGSTDPVIEFLPPGIYSVTVTDALSDMATDDEEILVTSFHPNYQGGFDGLVNCPGDDPYAFVYLDDPHHGPEPHSITTPGTLFGNFSDMSAQYSYYAIWMDTAPGSWVTVDWTDGSGCPGSTYLQLSSTFVQPTVQIPSVLGACNGSNGRISVAVSGVASGQYFRVNIRTLNGQIPPSQQFNFGGQDVSNNTSFNFSNLAAGAYWIITDPDILGTVPNDEGGQLYCVDSMYVEVPDWLGQCAQVSGQVFIDHDQDCVKDANDPALRHRLIEFTPGPFYAITSSNGNYGINLANGSYSMEVEGTGTELYPICPTVQPIPVVVSGVNQVVNVADSSLVPLDLVTTISAGPARIGFEHSTWMRIRNTSGQASGSITATMEFDPQMSFISAEPAPLSVAGNTVTWSLPALNGFDQVEASVLLQVPADIGLFGLPFSHLASASQSITESDLANNAATWNAVFTASYDPNDKLVHTSTGASESLYFIDQDEWMDYTIRFQNTGTDTAFTVVVRDVLPATLDMGTFEQGIASHPFEVSFKPGRTVEWRFANILLPDSNVNEGRSHGQVTFRIRPVLPLLPGTEISNSANIYFDFNPPVTTEPSVLVADFSTAVGEVMRDGSKVYPNPASDRIYASCPECGGTPYYITIQAVDGRIVLQATLTSGAEGIDISTLANGTYLLRTIGTKGSTTASFIKEAGK
ncbi:MAG: T9SS type A sorting domain-containing protein [Flavobacteriales bacterium]|nr:T9SS type A sorting domain-containing protein [Flavobacteriales bacterium]